MVFTSSANVGSVITGLEDSGDALSRQFDGTFSCSASGELSLQWKTGLVEDCSVLTHALVVVVDKGGRMVPGFG